MTKKYEGQGLIDSDDLYRAFKDYDAALPGGISDYNELENKPLVNIGSLVNVPIVKFNTPTLIVDLVDDYDVSMQVLPENPNNTPQQIFEDWSEIVQEYPESSPEEDSRFGEYWRYEDSGLSPNDISYSQESVKDSYGEGNFRIVLNQWWAAYNEGSIDTSDIISLPQITKICTYVDVAWDSENPTAWHLSINAPIDPDNPRDSSYSINIAPAEGQSNVEFFDPEGVIRTIDGVERCLVSVDIALEKYATDSRDINYGPINHDVKYSIWNQLDHPDIPVVPPAKEKGYGTYPDEFDKLFWADCLDDDDTEGNMVQLDEFISGTLSPNGYSSIGAFAASLGGDLDPRINLVGDGSIEISTNVGDPIPEVWVYTDGDVSGRWIKVQDAAKGIMMADQSAYDMVNDIHYPQDDSNPAFAFGFNSVAGSATYVTTIKLNSLWSNDIRFKVIAGVNKYTGQGKTTIS